MTTTADHVGFAAGSTVVVRDEEWTVSACESTDSAWRVRCVGRSELVRGTAAVFFSNLDTIETLDPAAARLIRDRSPRNRRSRLWVEATLRKTPLPLHEPGLSVSDDMLLDSLDFQRQAVAVALHPGRLRPRLLVADAVGLGKTLEIGMILAELTRRGRADRVLVVTPRHVLEQMQYELWTRFALPLVRLDSAGIQQVRRRLPASRNPFTHHRRVIVSVDTLKSTRYRAHLQRHRWDVVVIDESHNVTNAGAQRSGLARVLAEQTDSLILASATPHNGDRRSFAELLALLDPTAIVDPLDYDRADIEHLYVRRHRHSPDVDREVGNRWAKRPEPTVLSVAANTAEDAIATELSTRWLYPGSAGSPIAGPGKLLFPWTLAKAFLSSPDALVETVAHRRREVTSACAEQTALDRLGELAQQAVTEGSAKLDTLVAHLLDIGVASTDVRVVLFSERIATLRWLRRELPARLGLSDDAFEVLHGGLPDATQLRIVERFGLAATPLRVLITGDVASEGVNLHKRCHHLVHVDIPWSLIRIEQRNGRIDRYGQQHPPRIAALALTTTDDRFSGDIRVLSRLLAKEHAAHTALGDAGSLMRLHDAGREEDEIRRALARGISLDDVVSERPLSIDDFEATFMSTDQASVALPRAQRASLFDRDVDFLRESISEAFDRPADPPGRGGVGWVEHDGDLVELVAPADLSVRLSALPQSYLTQRRVHERLVLATTREAGGDQLRRAVAGSTADGTQTQWPIAHYLGPLHPVLDWAADRALSRVGRNEVPVTTARVEHPTAIVLGTLTDHQGRVLLRSVVGMEFPPGWPEPVVRTDPHDQLLAEAGFRDGTTNAATEIDLHALHHVVPDAVTRMDAHMRWLARHHRDQVSGPLDRATAALDRWAAGIADRARRMAPPQAAAQHNRVARLGAKHDELVQSMAPRSRPTVRVLLVLVPDPA